MAQSHVFLYRARRLPRPNTSGVTPRNDEGASARGAWAELRSARIGGGRGQERARLAAGPHEGKVDLVKEILLSTIRFRAIEPVFYVQKNLVA